MQIVYSNEAVFSYSYTANHHCLCSISLHSDEMCGSFPLTFKCKEYFYDLSFFYNGLLQWASHGCCIQSCFSPIKTARVSPQMWNRKRAEVVVARCCEPPLAIIQNSPGGTEMFIMGSEEKLRLNCAAESGLAVNSALQILRIFKFSGLYLFVLGMFSRLSSPIYWRAGYHTM